MTYVCQDQVPFWNSEIVGLNIRNRSSKKTSHYHFLILNRQAGLENRRNGIGIKVFQEDLQVIIRLLNIFVS